MLCDLMNNVKNDTHRACVRNQKEYAILKKLFASDAEFGQILDSIRENKANPNIREELMDKLFEKVLAAISPIH